MNITRNNYEEFFMLYADNELTAAQRKEVEEFLAANTDLQHELEMFQQFKLTADTGVVFEHKASLLKQDTGILGINITNCESFFVLYADDELTNSEKAGVESFVYNNPQLQETFELLQQIRLAPDTSIVFENKESLYRKEEDDKVVPFRWWKMAAAAAIILFVTGIFWLNNSNKPGKVNDSIAGRNSTPAAPSKQPSVQGVKDAPAEKNTVTEPTTNQTIAVTNTDKVMGQVKSIPAKNIISAINTNEKINNKNSNLQTVQSVTLKEDVAENSYQKGAVIAGINGAIKKVDIKAAIPAAAGNLIPDQPSIIVNPDIDNNTKVEFAALNSNDNIEVLNTSVNTKNSLRGFLRKASRIIAKKTNGGNEDGTRKSILIGGFEIAVR
ncbi:MAG: hypothetical protein ABUT20_46000 [Bacteroidota bacterium]